jgi:LysM domain
MQPQNCFEKMRCSSITCFANDPNGLLRNTFSMDYVARAMNESTWEGERKDRDVQGDRESLGTRKERNPTTWDYIWEPVKPRSGAKHPSIPPKPAPIPPSIPAPAAVKTYSVPGDSLSKIAQKFYGNPSLWSKIYQANKALIGPNPNLILPGQTLTIP